MRPTKVVVTADYDCDGIGYGYHRFVGDDALDAVAWFCHARGAVPMGVDITCPVMPEELFLDRIAQHWTDWDAAYWLIHGYHGSDFNAAREQYSANYCHCEAHLEGSDHCPACGCEVYESDYTKCDGKDQR